MALEKQADCWIRGREFSFNNHMDKEYAQYLIDKTKEDYNLISESFSSTRQFFWEDLRFLIDYTSSRDNVLDVGCGNGRLLEVLKNKKVNYFGVDNSQKLIEIAQKKFPEGNFKIADILNLPFPENYFDKVYCIAVLHHIPSAEFKLRAFTEMRKVLKPEGLLILTVWNMWQRETAWKEFFKGIFLKIIGKSKLDFKDILYPWKDKKGRVIAERYFHLFTKNELKKLAKKAGFKVKKIGISKRPEMKDNNIFLVAEK